MNFTATETRGRIVMRGMLSDTYLMKITNLLFGAALLGLSACSNGSKPAGAGPAADQDRPVPSASANAMDVSAPLDLHVTIGDQPSCRLKGPSRLVGRLKTEMDGNTFRIFTESRMNWNANETIEAWVTIPHLQTLRTSGAGDIVVDTRIEEPAVRLELNGAVNVDLAGLQTQQLDLELGGAGDVLIRNGEAAAGRFSIAGTGNIDAFELKVGNAEVSVSGAGRAALTAVDRLKAGISGAGMIRYKGNPVIEKEISGIGTLQNAN